MESSITDQSQNTKRPPGMFHLPEAHEERRLSGSHVRQILGVPLWQLSYCLPNLVRNWLPRNTAASEGL